MGRVRFGLRSGFFFLVLAGVAAPLAMTTNAAEGRHHPDVPAQRVHDFSLVDPLDLKEAKAVLDELSL